MPEWLQEDDMGPGGTPASREEAQQVGGRDPLVLIWTIDEELIGWLVDLRPSDLAHGE